MAKLLTIGCSYNPSYQIKSNDGSKRNEPVVSFFFNCDARTANLVVGSGVSKGLKVEGNSVRKNVFEDKYEDFLYSKKLFPAIIAEFEKYGYEYDMNQLDSLRADVENAIQTYVNSNVQKQVNNEVSSFIEKLINAMEQNMSDPNFMAFLESIGSIRKFVGNDNINKLTELSTSNKILILTQWINRGRQGHPTFVATKKQFRLAGYNVNPGATPLYFIRPTGVVGRKESQVISDFGITDYDTNDARKIQVDKLSHDRDFGNNNATEFILNFSPYYDISDCTEFRASNLKDFIDQDKSASSIAGTLNKDKQDQQKKEVIANINLQNKNVLTDSTMCENARKYAENRGDTKLAAVASRGSAAEVVKFLVNNAESYLRDSAQRYAQHSSQTRDLLEALALKKLGMGNAGIDRIIAGNCGNLKYNGKVNKEMFLTVASDLDNIFCIMNGLKESVDNDTLMFVLNSCGISVEEFKNMPQDEMEAEETLNTVRENFVRIFNNIIKG